MQLKAWNMKLQKRLPRRYFVPYLGQNRKSFPFKVRSVYTDMQQNFQTVFRHQSDRMQRRMNMDHLPMNRGDQFPFLGYKGDTSPDKALGEDRVINLLERDHSSLHGGMKLNLLHIHLHELLDLFLDQL